MEWSVHVRGVEDLRGELSLERFAACEPSARLRPAVDAAARAASAASNGGGGPIRFTRCAFGTEFCENLLHAAGAAAETRAAALERVL